MFNLDFATVAYAVLPTGFTAAVLLQAAETGPTPLTWAGLGIGGAMAVLIFQAYREDRKKSEDRLKEANDRFATVVERLLDVVQDRKS